MTMSDVPIYLPPSDAENNGAGNWVSLMSSPRCMFSCTGPLSTVFVGIGVIFLTLSYTTLTRSTRDSYSKGKPMVRATAHGLISSWNSTRSPFSQPGISSNSSVGVSSPSFLQTNSANAPISLSQCAPGIRVTFPILSDCSTQSLKSLCTFVVLLFISIVPSLAPLQAFCSSGIKYLDTALLVSSLNLYLNSSHSLVTLNRNSPADSPRPILALIDPSIHRRASQLSP